MADSDDTGRVGERQLCVCCRQNPVTEAWDGHQWVPLDTMGGKPLCSGCVFDSACVSRHGAGPAEGDS